MSNLPDWSGAQHCYSKAYELLVRMSRTHVSISRGKCYVSPEMQVVIDALNKGEEEPIKAILMYLPY